LFDEVEAEVAAREEIHDHIEILSILECHDSVDEELVFDAFE
jgi:hypothetical protein